MNAPVELFRSADLLVRARLLPGDARCVVAFDHHGEDPSLDRAAFAEHFLDSRGLSWIAVLGRGNHWYHYPDVPAALAAIREAVAGRARVMTYGSSMGGHAALRFADAVGANACLALSPQYSIHRDAAPFEDRWAQEAAAIRWPAEGEPPIRCACVPIVVYDGASVDALHAERIAADTPVRCLPLPHAGHPVGTALAVAGMLEPLVKATLDGDFEAAAFVARWRGGRARNPIYLAELGSRLQDRRLPLAIALTRQAMALHPAHPFLQHMLATLLTRSGAHGEALALYEAAVSASGGEAPLVQGHSIALAAAGQGDAALALARRLLAERPDQAHLHGLLAMLLWGQRRRGEAITSARAALALAPGSRHHGATLAWYLHRSHPMVRLRRWLTTQGRRLLGRSVPADLPFTPAHRPAPGRRTTPERLTSAP